LKELFLAYGTLSHLPIDLNYPLILTGTNTTHKRRNALRSVAKKFLVDVGVDPKGEKTPQKIAEIQYSSQVDVASSPDVFGNTQLTVERAIEWNNELDELGYNNERIFVLQSDDRSPEKYLECLDGHKENKEVEYIGIGGLIKENDGTNRPLKKNMTLLSELIPQITEKIHIFGAGLGITSKGILEELRWESLDSATSLFAAREHKIFDNNLKRQDLNIEIPRGKNSGIYVKMLAIANHNIASLVLNKKNSESIEHEKNRVITQILTYSNKGKLIV